MKNSQKLKTVAVSSVKGSSYPKEAPFHPDKFYPEYDFAKSFIGHAANPVYEAVRESFILLGLDKSHFGESQWNPLSDFLHPGDRVLIKPNWILHRNHSPYNTDCMITHGSIIRAVTDYVIKAVGKKGRILIADAPNWDASFEEIVKTTGIDKVVEFYKRQGIKVGLEDLRSLRVKLRHGLVSSRKIDKRQLAKRRIVDLGVLSELEGLKGGLKNLFGSDYNLNVTRSHHKRGQHEYCISQELLSADAIINLPKLKTHKKAGITVAMKNLVGINTDKNFLPHYRLGDIKSGGDEYPQGFNWRQRVGRKLVKWVVENLLGRFEGQFIKISQPILKLFARITGLKPAKDGDYTDPGYNNRVIEKLYQILTASSVRAGNWWGNDTVWRMIIDLNKIAFYADKNGQIQSRPQRVHFCVVDGVIGGQGEGPLAPEPIKSGLIIAGFNPFCIDWMASRLMGFDPWQIPFLRETLKVKEKIIYGGSVKNLEPLYSKFIEPLHFKPHRNWTNLLLKKEAKK